jgi:hypothetical protein
VLGPDNFLPNRCTLPSGIDCIDHKVTDVFGPGIGELYIVIRNKPRYDIKNGGIGTSDCTCGTTETLIRNGADPATLIATSCTVTRGKKYEDDINIINKNSDSGLMPKLRSDLLT